ncbi:chemotaxis protein CheW [Caldithrix abyssi]|uniref:CheW protein n=1 Tax=Caldithrix abyssi DSM 13497 TaxID=880073 RepID=H1XVZ6_CALAY|nr:chemotaxis protein CheW [Caldithrix abyssi]APF17684.1 CheW-like domain-containing protein [Caldithrix abyssi DSM 13497]EHO41768.1 CheW protein [Caldithrix abyssi DSM 13497]
METEARVSLIKISDQYFAIEIKYIREVLPLPQVTKVPNVEKQFLGVFNLRGKIVPLIDISPILKLQNMTLEPDHFVIYCLVNGKYAGILAEKVLEMRDLETEQLHVPGAEVNPDLLPYISAIYEETQYGTIYVLDMVSIFESAELNRYRFE